MDVSTRTSLTRGPKGITDGRYNESRRLSERRLHFNVAELKKVAAACLNQPESNIKKFYKLSEGGFNRVFQVTMNDGSEILARLPYPLSQPRNLAMASEIATLDLVRSYGLPVPKVLDYSTDSRGPVGAEFMIIEKFPGEPMGDRWLGLPEAQRLKIISEVVQMEAKLFQVDLPAYGSVYYMQDLPSDMASVPFRTINGKELCVGPDVGLRWWYKERESLHVNRGPCRLSPALWFAWHGYIF